MLSIFSILSSRPEQIIAKRMIRGLEGPAVCDAKPGCEGVEIESK